MSYVMFILRDYSEAAALKTTSKLGERHLADNVRVGLNLECASNLGDRHQRAYHGLELFKRHFAVAVLVCLDNRLVYNLLKLLVLEIASNLQHNDS